jgi:N-methylhydantoinase A/oxoprolinase/acetone carboxylase beta subunit
VHVGVDTGGTFTDVVVGSDAPGTIGAAARRAGTVEKVPSTPDAPQDAVARALGLANGAEPVERPRLLAHGTTVATNALLEGRLARVALVATQGFADVIEIARQVRPSLYDQHVDRPPALVPRQLRFEVSGRLDASGREVEPFDGRLPPGLLAAVRDGEVDAIAVCLLHADLDAVHEAAVLTALGAAFPDRAEGPRLLASHEVSPEIREYERAVTTVVDAALAPLCTDYLSAVASLADEVLVMTSAGGLVPVTTAAAHPASLLVSGPAAGVRAAAAVAVACGFAEAVSFDMGGTSTDVCLIRDGVPEPAPSRVAGGYPIRLPSLNVHTIGAGGGSIARLDAGGALMVGPESAGARPGPACYGHGGLAPTVADADLVLGRLPPGTTLPGIGLLDAAAAAAALERVVSDAAGAEECARQVLAVVDAAMEQAVRVVTVEEGVDPRTLALVAFGGAGPMHACAIAGALGMRAVIVPPRAGVFSAVGLLCSPRAEEVVQSWRGGTDASAIGQAFDRLEPLVVERVRAAGASIDTVDCRYEGQSHELTVVHEQGSEAVAGWNAFHRVHEQRNGFARTDVPVEVVALRVRASVQPALRVDELPPPARARVRGPHVVAEADCTVWVPQGWTAEPGATGAWVITRA